MRLSRGRGAVDTRKPSSPQARAWHGRCGADSAASVGVKPDRGGRGHLAPAGSPRAGSPRLCEIGVGETTLCRPGARERRPGTLGVLAM